MVVSIALVLALNVTLQATGPSKEIATFERLVASAKARQALSQQEQVTLPGQRARVEALQQFTQRAHRRLTTGQVSGSDLFNLFQVSRDLVDAGTGLCLLPEERLCWQRAGLTLAETQHRFVSAGVAAGTLQSQHLDYASAQVEFFRTGYRRVLLECIPAPR